MESSEATVGSLQKRLPPPQPARPHNPLPPQPPGCSVPLVASQDPNVLDFAAAGTRHLLPGAGSLSQDRGGARSRRDRGRARSVPREGGLVRVGRCSRLDDPWYLGQEASRWDVAGVHKSARRDGPRCRSEQRCGTGCLWARVGYKVGNSVTNPTLVQTARKRSEGVMLNVIKVLTKTSRRKKEAEVWFSGCCYFHPLRLAVPAMVPFTHPSLAPIPGSHSPAFSWWQHEHSSHLPGKIGLAREWAFQYLLTPWIK